MNENTFLYTLKDIYSECNYHENEIDRGKLEHYAFRHGLEKLNADDAYKVDRYIKKLSSPEVKIRNLGDHHQNFVRFGGTVKIRTDAVF